MATAKQSNRHGYAERKRVFIEEYARTLSGTQAALKAGYSPKTAVGAGSRMLRTLKDDPAFIQAMEVRKADAAVDGDYVLSHLKAIVQDPHTLPKDRVKALDLLGRYASLWNGGADKQIPDTIQVVLKDAD